MIMDEIVSAALLGTRGAAARLPALPDDLAAALPAQSSDPESQLLDAGASVTLYSRAGVMSQAGIPLPKPCATDRTGECSPRAADLLSQVFEDRLQPLLVEWLELAAGAERRPPHSLLPALLDAAAGKRALQPLVAAVIDERGRWLTQFNPRWQFTSSAAEPAEDVWETGNTQQRAEALRAVRQSDPAKARELIASTWQDDGAEDRAQWVNCLLQNLDGSDEAFLESCLDDRSSRVREAAADLLARLPQSQLVGGMIDRLRPLVSFTPGTAGQLLKLKRATKASFEVQLPAVFDKSMQRDGMTEKPSEQLGPKQWWLLQILARVPMSFWTDTYAAPPETLIDALPKDFAAVFIRGWLASLARTPTPGWIEPLLAAAPADLLIDEQVLQAASPPERSAVLRSLLKSPREIQRVLPRLLAAWRPLDETVSRLLLDYVDLPMLLYAGASFYLHPRTLPELETKFTRAEMPEYHGLVDQTLSVISLRRDLHKELSP